MQPSSRFMDIVSRAFACRPIISNKLSTASGRDIISSQNQKKERKKGKKMQ